MGAGRTGGADGVVISPDLKRRRQSCGIGGRHDARHHEGTDPLCRFLARGIPGPKHVLGRRTARPHDQARALIGNFVLCQARIVDCLLHGDIVEGRTIPHESQQLLINMIADINIGLTMNMAAESAFFIVVAVADATAAVAQGLQHLVLRIADTRHDANSGDYYPPRVHLRRSSIR